MSLFDEPRPPRTKEEEDEIWRKFFEEDLPALAKIPSVKEVILIQVPVSPHARQ